MSSPLSQGTKLGRYEIRSKIGAGGMGEVYLADDTMLHRKVALKILPSGLSANEDRMRRFIQEAQAAAALNHPNIAHIYEIGEAEGVPFIAMEYIEGTTLRQKIHHEQTELKKLLRYLQHAADGLAKAHAAGIVHRDFKPDNIMITRDGHAKILDFGLAKLVEQSKPLDLSDSTAATIAMQQHSQPGTILGTVGYLSPEQAQGKVAEIDHRSDVFSFGCVLFEAVTGHGPFEGDTVINSLHKVIYDPAPPIKDFNPHAPPDLQRIIRRCLAKDPEERYQAMKDVAIELKELRRELEGGADLDVTITPESGSAARRAGQPTTSNLTEATREGGSARATSSVEYISGELRKHKAGALIALVLLAFVGAAAVFGIYKLIGSRSGSSAAVPFQQMDVTSLTSSGKSIHAAISPDGKYAAYVLFDNGQQSLWVRQVTAANDIAVVPPAPIDYWGMTFSRDSNDLYYVTREKNGPGVLYRIPALGGMPQKLLTRLDTPVTFSPDGQQMAFVRGAFPNPGESALMIANIDGSGEQTLARRSPPEFFYPISYAGPSWSPDGKLVALALQSLQGIRHANVIAVDVRSGKEQVLTTEKFVFIRRVEWLPNGNGLLMIARDQELSPFQIWHVSSGEARRITSDLDDYRSLSVTADSSKLVTVKLSGQWNIWIAPNGDANRAVQITSGKLEGVGISWTPDDKIVYSSSTSGNYGVWIMDPRTGDKKQLTLGAGFNLGASVSPDGRYIVFMSTRAGHRNIWRIDIDGGNPNQLTSGINDATPTISPDGKWVIYASLAPDFLSLWKVSIDGGQPVRLTDKPSSVPSVSPDGKLIACLYLESLNATDQLPNKIAIIPFDGGAPIKTFDFQNSPTSSAVIHWSSDGSAVIYNEARNGVSNIWSQPLSGGPPKQLTVFKENLIQAFDWSRDGKQLACSRGFPIRDAVLISSHK